MSELPSARKGGAAKTKSRWREINADLRHDLFKGLNGFLQCNLVWVVIRGVLLYVYGIVGREEADKKKKEFVRDKVEWRIMARDSGYVDTLQSIVTNFVHL